MKRLACSLLLLASLAGGCREVKTKEQLYAEREQQILTKMEKLRQRQTQITAKLAELEERLVQVRKKRDFHANRWAEPTPTLRPERGETPDRPG